jgi:thymidylate synthase
MSLKSVFINGKNLDDIYFQLLSEIYKHGRINKIDSGSFAGSNRLEFDFVAGTIQYPTIRPLSPIFPSNTPPVTTDDDIEDYFINYIMDGQNLEDNEHYRYSTWIRGGGYKIPKLNLCTEGFDKATWVVVPDQIQWCIDHYKDKGFGNNHCYITVGYPESSFAYDIPWKDESERETSPCLRGIDTHIKHDEGKWYLCLAVIFRSWDLYAGFPVNMGGIAHLMEFMANELGIEVGTLSFSSLKGHLYDFQIEPLKIRLGVE